jgi:hypothetical protein
MRMPSPLPQLWPPLSAALIVSACIAAARAEDFSATSSRTRVDCGPAQSRDKVYVLMGQSNAANHGEQQYTPKGDVVNFNWIDTGCYRSADPLLGASVGPVNKGSIWNLFADALLDSGLADRIILAPVAYGGTTSAQWVPNGVMWPRVEAVMTGLRRHGLEPDGYLVVQGEADARVGSDGRAYKENWRATAKALRTSLRSDAPIWIAVATTCYQDAGPNLEEVTPDIRAAKWQAQEMLQRAQRDLVDSSLGIRPGPNLDFIDSAQRLDNRCHLKAYGQRAAADLWKRAVLGQ